MSHAINHQRQRITLLVSLFTLVTLACAALSQAIPSQLPSPSVSQISTAITSTPLAIQPAAQDTPTLTSPATAAPTHPSQPVVVAHYCIKADCSDYTYPGDMMSGHMGGVPGVLLVLPGQLWTAVYPGGIQEWNPQDGRLLNSISADYETGNFTDIQYDGKQIWVSQYIPLSATESSKVLYVIDPSQAHLIKKISIKYGESDENAESFGVSPGKVWLEHQWINTDSFQINDASHYFGCDEHYGYDGQGLMWVTGEADPTYDCMQDLYVWSAANPAGQPLPSDTQGSYDGSPLVLANGKMWMMAKNTVKTSSGWSHPWLLTAYNLNDPKKPAIQVDISQYMPELNGNLLMAADNKVIWIASDTIKGNIDYYELDDGHHMGSLQVGQLIYGMGFDGSSLWVLDNVHGLEQIALPWGG